MSDITMQQARAAVDAARKRSDELGVKMNIAIVDGGANLKAFLRMDGAWLGSIDIAIKKARTARMFDMNTGRDRQVVAARRFAVQHRAFKRRSDHLSGWCPDQEWRGGDHRSDWRVGEHRRGRSRCSDSRG